MEKQVIELLEIIADLKNYLYEEDRFEVKVTEQVPANSEPEAAPVPQEEKPVHPAKPVREDLIVPLPKIKNMSDLMDTDTLFSHDERDIDSKIEGMDKEAALNTISDIVAKCSRCPLNKSRKQAVFGEGDINSPLMMIGEAPGKEEDEQGLPFVGDAGKLLTKMLNAIDINRNDVYICNVVKCRPPGNRTPEPEEIDKCSLYLIKQIQLIKPKIILSMGNVPTQYLFKTRQGITKMRGIFYNFSNFHVLPTFHPSALLYHPAQKKYSWQDLKFLYTFLYQEKLL